MHAVEPGRVGARIEPVPPLCEENKFMKVRPLRMLPSNPQLHPNLTRVPFTGKPAIDLVIRFNSKFKCL